MQARAPTAVPTLQPGDRLLSMQELKRIVPLSTRGIYQKIREGTLPAGLRIGPNRVAWLERQVIDALNATIAAANGAQAKS